MKAKGELSKGTFVEVVAAGSVTFTGSKDLDSTEKALEK